MVRISARSGRWWDAAGQETIFFTHCNLRCSFCQNFDISHRGEGQAVTAAQLAAIMLHLQAAGCHNINFVTPSHVVAQILPAVALAVDQGLTVPLIYNTGAYDSVETLRLLEGVIDIYMPDFKFWQGDIATRTCEAPDYRQRASEAIREMHRQVGDLSVGADGLAVRGLLVRHLVLPENLAGTADIMGFIAREVSKDTLRERHAPVSPLRPSLTRAGLGPARDPRGIRRRPVRYARRRSQPARRRGGRHALYRIATGRHP